MGAHLIFFIIFPLFSCIILTNQSLTWYSLRSGFQCDTKMAAVFSGMRPEPEVSKVAVSVTVSVSPRRTWESDNLEQIQKFYQ